MTDEQIEKAAQHHADELRVSSSIPGALVPMLHDIAKDSYIHGAREALASQWKDPKVELPEDEETVLTLSSYGPVLAYYSKQDEMWFAYGNYGDITPTHWFYIPPLKGGGA